MKTLSIFLIFVCFNALAQNNGLNKYLKSKGSSNGDLLEGGIGNHLLFYEPEVKISPPKIEITNNIPYDKLLYSGLKSLLFEYKNYHGSVDGVAYLIFAYGNYGVISEKILLNINKYFFPNKKLMKTIYDWAKPYYIDVFNELTFNEQFLMFTKLQIAEKYVSCVLRQKNNNAYLWRLKKMKIKDDDKLTSFFKRRVDKNQWTIDDCEYWIRQVKSDFPALKNREEPISHLQITKIINEACKIASTDSGYYFLVDKNNNKISEKCSQIVYDDRKSIFLYRKYNNLLNYYDPLKYIIADNGELILPQNPAWTDWEILSGNYFYFMLNGKCGITKNGVYFMSGYDDIFRLNKTNLVIASKNGIGKVFRYDGSLICLDSMNISNDYFEGNDPTPESIDDLAIRLINNNQFLIIKNFYGKFGIVRIDGKIILPFDYDSIANELNNVFANIGDRYYVFEIKPDGLLLLE